MKITVTINAEPIEVDYEKSEVGEEFEAEIPNTSPPIKIKMTKYAEKMLAFEREFDIIRSVANSPAGQRQFFQFNGFQFSTIEQVVHYLSTF